MREIVDAFNAAAHASDDMLKHLHLRVYKKIKSSGCGFPTEFKDIEGTWYYAPVSKRAHEQNNAVYISAYVEKIFHRDSLQHVKINSADSNTTPRDEVVNVVVLRVYPEMIEMENNAQRTGPPPTGAKSELVWVEFKTIVKLIPAVKMMVSGLEYGNNYQQAAGKSGDKSRAAFNNALLEMHSFDLKELKADKARRVEIYKRHGLDRGQWSHFYRKFTKLYPRYKLGVQNKSRFLFKPPPEWVSGGVTTGARTSARHVKSSSGIIASAASAAIKRKGEKNFASVTLNDNDWIFMGKKF